MCRLNKLSFKKETRNSYRLSWWWFDVYLFVTKQSNTLCWWFQQNSVQIIMCCRPKASFLIDDILQHSSSKPPDAVNPPWPARPTPVYLNQMSPMHHTSEAVRVPTLTSATRGVYMTDVFGTQDGLRIYNSSYQRNSQPLADSIMDGPYSGMWVSVLVVAVETLLLSLRM